MSKYTSGNAFPNGSDEDAGISVRAYFAGQFCAAMVSTIRTDFDYNRLRDIAMAHDLDTVSQFFAHEACKQADALIAELAK